MNISWMKCGLAKPLRTVAIISCSTLLVPAAGQSESLNTTDSPVEIEQRLQLIEARLKEINQTSDNQKISPVEKRNIFFEDPKEIVLTAESLIATKRYREAYLLLKQIRGLPTDKVNDATVAEACLNAARLAGINYRMARFKEPKSIWVLSEPEATFQWVCSIEGLEDEKSRILIETLLRNTPTQFWRRFDAFREDHFPDSFPWRIEVELDNGKVENVVFTEIITETTKRE